MSLENQNLTESTGFNYLPEKIANVLLSQGITSPTEVQKTAFDPILNGKDLLAQSPTGSGKTLAFAIPLAMRIVDAPKTAKTQRTPKALILTPTRELAEQVNQVFIKTLSSLHIRTTCIIGGSSYRRQKEALQAGVDILVGTPGRIVDLIQQDILDLSQVQTFVLDEVDEMLDVGFCDALQQVRKVLPKTLQTLFFSATLSSTAQKLARALLVNPVQLNKAHTQTDAPKIEHSYILCNVGAELKTLVNILLYKNPSQAIIFCETKRECQEITEALCDRGLKSSELNSDLDQRDRQWTMAQFKKGTLRFLVATNIAARGIDVKGLPLVINLSVPRDNESYTHRTGRTGRAGEQGSAWTLVTPPSVDRYRRLVRDIGIKPLALPIPGTFEILTAQLQGTIEGLRQSITVEDERTYKRAIEKVMQTIEPEKLKELLENYLKKQTSHISIYDSGLLRTRMDSIDFEARVFEGRSGGASSHRGRRSSGGSSHRGASAPSRSGGGASSGSRRPGPQKTFRDRPSR